MSTERDAPEALATEAAARTLSWLVTLGIDVDEPGLPESSGEMAPAPDLLEGVRHDDEGFAFARKLLEAVVGASDPFAAALSLREVSRELPQSMPIVERLAVRAGGLASLGLPWAVLPVARKWLRERVSHLVLSAKLTGGADGTAPNLADVAAALRQATTPTTLALGGVKLVGDAGANRELQRLLALTALPEVTHLSVDAARLAPAGINGNWALDHDADVGAKRLRTLLETAGAHDVTVILESEDYRSALLAPQMLVKALAVPGIETVRTGVSLPVELPESLQAAQALIQFSRVRVSTGGMPLEIGIGATGMAAREQIASILTGHPVPTIEGRPEQAAHWLRVLKALLAAGQSVRPVAASDDAHLLAAATVLAERAGADLTLQLRAGIAPELETAISEHGFSVRRRLPLVASKEFSAAAGYLIALAAETASSDSVLLHTRAMLDGESAQFREGTRRLTEVLELASHAAPESHRVQHRDLEWSEEARNTTSFYRAPTEANRIDTGGLTAAVLGLTRAHTGAITMEVLGEMLRVPVISATGFANEPDTDASRFDNRSWARNSLARAKRSDIGIEALQTGVQLGVRRDEAIAAALIAVESWRELPASDRGKRVARLALGVAAARDRLIEVLAAESGAAVSVLDADVSGAIDAARYLGQLAGGLGVIRGAEFHPDRLALVVADAGTPLAERAEAVLAPLATGCAVILLAHPTVARSSAVLIEELRAAGLPEGVLRLVVADSTAAAAERHPHIDLATAFAADTRVDRALVAGARDTARELLRRRPDLRVQGRFRAPGVTVITPSADPVAAVRNAVASAFAAGHGDPNAARVLVLLGAASRSQALRETLIDAVRSLPVGSSVRPGEHDPLALTLGFLPEPPSEAGLRALTQLNAGEQWLVQPEQLDDEGLLWKPGVRAGLSRDSTFWKDAVGVPVIGVISAHSIDEAISLTNRLGGGGVAALEANDASETLPWLERARAASLFLGRPTTGARIERQPGGGWGDAGMGAEVLTGGPNRALMLGSWSVREGTASSTLHLRGLKPEVRLLIEVAQASLDYPSFDRVRRAALSDTLTWRTVLGKAEDVIGLGVERNLLRHRPVGSHLRLAEDGSVAELIRVVCAGLVSAATMTVSTGVVLPPEVSEFLAMQGVTVSLERDDDWLERVAVSGPGDGETPASRVRLVGGDRVRTAEWLGGLGDVTLWAEPVTMAGPIELLAFVQEQSVSVAAHRHDLAMLPVGVGAWIAELQGRDSF